ncbi:mannose-P-dolichol utilization defect 1 protein [Salmo trutta]|uniref:Solute carrier family 66 member 3 n=1 Tax=Salmo trutta TaxID=8032 RepID=A0A674BUE0_SALTR|nr:mannose-P-dolichol utilization defect 1 protein-like [Salmo trutta]
MDTSEVEELLSPTKEFLLTYILPEKCYNYFFVDLNFLHVPCWNIVLSKTVGVWIILGTVMAQLPQLWKVLRARSASGISWWSVLLQVYAITGSVVYCITNNFPLEAWSERLFMFMQGLAMGFLIQHYSGNTLKGILFLLAYGGVMMLLTSPLVPEHVIPAMQASSMLAVVASRVIQGGTNYYHGNTGQLSALSVFLVFTGSLALIFTSLQETGDWSSVSTVTHVVAACLSCLLLTQVVCYRNSRTKDKTE